QENPPQACDADTVEEFLGIGFPPSDAFAFDALDPIASQAAHRAIRSAQLRMSNAEKKAARVKTVNNWSLSVHPGHYGQNYLDRAVAARNSGAAALAEDVLCFHTTFDHRSNNESEAEALTGNGRPPAVIWKI